MTLGEVPMNPSSMKKKVALVLAEKFLRDLEETTSIGRSFIDAARPAVTRLFKELTEDRQALLMYLLMQTATKHKPDDAAFDIEKLATEGSLALKNIDIKSLEKMKQQVQYIHGVVASTMLVSYGGLGERKIAVEG